ncbi:uncharacterized protein NECHADRAFT_74553 [Fusarium vanettenii 77-13-4]|uniref:Uncharacterized protein n=1 Tax=Fusarium vanettenii (strain ATCC MYA-4622 / CBS 123669 / FGSC 9596 / NRRL 45880 / 77-13-4) TaxID=660122 RepID=C7YKB8_FUSV7|nr:uncharacterized protein NECHADRAFT_74553 [Fusarium vanettenii 77-13-4]EEU48426.1 predicted protein [Fusarium vanettenii 77-13-4]
MGRAQPTNQDFVQIFPGLARAYEDGAFRGEAAGLVESLRSVPFEWAFVTGGPGSGKTTAALAIVKAVISQPARSSAPPVAIDQADTPKAEGDNVNDAEAENLGGHTESDAHGQIDDGLEHTSPDIPPPPALRWTDNKSDNKADGADCAEEETAGDVPSTRPRRPLTLFTCLGEASS